MRPIWDIHSYHDKAAKNVIEGLTSIRNGYYSGGNRTVKTNPFLKKFVLKRTSCKKKNSESKVETNKSIQILKGTALLVHFSLQ